MAEHAMSSILNTVVRYFDLQAGTRSGKEVIGVSRTSQELQSAAQYLVLIAAIMAQPYFESFRTTGYWTGRADPWSWILFAVIAGIIIFPAIYRGAFDPKKPILVQLCAIFAGGMGWETLLRTAGKLGGG
jgi:hypothetical protein